MDGRWGDRWANNQSFRIGWSAVFSGLAGIPMGLVYFLLAWVFRESFAALGALRGAGLDVEGDRGGPEMLFLLASGAGGWFAHWLAERLLGSCGWPLWIPVVAFAAVALGVGLGLGGLLITRWPQILNVAFVLSSVTLLLVAGLRIRFA